MKVSIPSEVTKRSILDAIDNPLWVSGNKVLYDYCRRNPLHNDISVIAGKLWIIGRSYAAPIERGAGGAHLDTIYRTAAEKLINSKIDVELSMLKRSDPPTSPIALRAHATVMASLPKKNGRAKCRRSVASKYLHFHRPEQFVLFDTRATSAASSLVRSPAMDRPETDHDEQYLKHATKCEALKDALVRTFGVALNNRQLDEFLLAFADRKRRA